MISVQLIHPIKDPTGGTVSKLKTSELLDIEIQERGVVLRFKREPETERLEPWSNVLEVVRLRAPAKGQ